MMCANAKLSQMPYLAVLMVYLFTEGLTLYREFQYKLRQ